MTRMRCASLLVVLAHPDDEIFHSGILAHLSERGVRVTLVCATDGEAGKPHPSLGPVDDLGACVSRSSGCLARDSASRPPCCFDFTTRHARSGRGTTIPTP